VRLAGHTLQAEGAAYRKGDPPNVRFPKRVTWNTTGGVGFGLCSCGAKSPVLDSGQKRKEWHKDHKRILMGYGR
jgi:hypothetical protein